MNHSVGHIALEGRIFQSMPPKRPLSIAELSEKARDDGWDETRELEYHLRIARECRQAGKECATRGDIEGAFVELTRAATLALERIPSHRNYYTILDANQRHNIALNGQDILDDLSYLKPLLVDELNDWFQTYGINDQERAAFVSQNWTQNIVGQASMQAQRKHEVEEWTRKKPFLAPDETLATSSLSLDINYSSESTNHRRHNHMNGPTKRPSSIAELAEKAKDTGCDETAEFKQHLRIAEKYRREGKECFKRGDLEGAFVELARAATIVLERLPSHRDYTMLNANQRHNLSLNGQDILDNLSDLKPALVDRYERWLHGHGSGEMDQDWTPTITESSGDILEDLNDYIVVGEFRYGIQTHGTGGIDQEGMRNVQSQKTINNEVTVQAQEEERAMQINEEKLPGSEEMAEWQQLFLLADAEMVRHERHAELAARGAANTLNHKDLPPIDALMDQEIFESAGMVTDSEKVEEAWDIGQRNEAEYVRRSMRPSSQALSLHSQLSDESTATVHRRISTRSPPPSIYSCASSRTADTDYGVYYTRRAPSWRSVYSIDEE